MLGKTHLAIGVFLAVFFLPIVNHKLVFVPIVLIASLLPDIDTGFSQLGRKWYSKPVQFFVKHRSVIHSFTICIIISFIFAFFIPILALPFFLGYSIHLLVDSFTIEGIRPFWPWKKSIEGKIRVGGRIEDVIFIVFIVLDVVFLIRWFL